MGSEKITVEFNDGTLLFRGMTPAVVAGLPQDAIKADDRVGGAYRALACNYSPLILALRQAGYTVEDNAKGFSPVKLILQSPFPPRDYQLQALEAWKQHGYRGIIALPTGSGKSFVGALACAKLGRQALVVVPTIDLMHQWAASLGKFFNMEIGLLGGGFHNISDITVATYDSAALHMRDLGNRFGLLICDECHHLPGPRNRSAAEDTLAPYRLGLSATPDLEGDAAVVLKRVLGELCCNLQINDLAGRVLAEYCIKQVPLSLSQEELAEYQETRSIYTAFVRRRRIDFRKPDGWTAFLKACAVSGREGRQVFSAFLRQRELSRGGEAKYRAVWDILCRHIDERIIIFTASNAQAYETGERFSLPVLTHRTKANERKGMLENFRTGKYPVLVSSRVLNEGVDVPEANIGIVVSGTSTGREYLQRLGRILRPAAGKKQAVLYELVNADTAEYYVAKRRVENTRKSLEPHFTE